MNQTITTIRQTHIKH